MIENYHHMVRWQSKLKRTARIIGHGLGLDPSLLSSSRGERILVYHGLCLADPFRYNTLFITQKTFETQLQLFKKYFNVVSLNDFYEQRFDHSRFNVCLSFDDGFANNYKYVLPLLEKYEIPAAFFITGIRDAGYDILWNDVLSIASGHGPKEFMFGKERFIKDRDGKYHSITKKLRLADSLRTDSFEQKAAMIELLGDYRYQANEDYWLQMTKDEIRAMSASKWVTIGSHSYYHNNLAQMKEKALLDDLNRSKQYLENITGKEVKALAFPYGSYSPATISAAKKAGYGQLLATESLLAGDEQEPLLKKRLTINPFISPINQLYGTIAGNYQ